MTHSNNARPDPPLDMLGHPLDDGSYLVDLTGRLWLFAGYYWATGWSGKGYRMRWRRGYWHESTEAVAIRHYHCVRVDDLDELTSSMLLRLRAPEVQAALARWHSDVYSASPTALANRQALAERKRAFQERLRVEREAP